MSEDRIKLQGAEFDALEELMKTYGETIQRVAIVDDGYPEARHQYESALHTFIEALALNGRFAPQSRGALMLNRAGVRVMEKN